MRRVIWLVVALGCSDQGADRRAEPLWSDGQHLRDKDGRIALLRGVNARVEGVFDVTFDDGRTPLEPIPALTPSDCRRMRALGLDLLRLPINWSGIEPVRDSFDDAYLAAVDTAVACAADAGLYVVIDLHQDAYSKEIGEDGAPLWAIVPPPDMLLQGPLDDLGDRRTSAQVLRAFDSFFAEGDPHGLQAQFIEMLELVGARWGQHPAVIGFELFNEPIGLAPLISAFDEKAAAAIGRVAPTKLVFFEPSSLRNFTDAAPLARAPFPEPNAVYSPHIYTFVFSPDRTHLEQLQPSDLELSVRDARTEAEAWKTPLFIGEFGIGPTDPNADLWMNVQSELHDAVLASNAFWVWKEQSQASWGVHAWDGAQWSERPQVVGWISRIHAARIAGTVIANQWDRITESLTLVTTSASRAHAIYIPERFAATVRVTCNDVPAAPVRDAVTGLIEVACDGTLHVAPSLKAP